MQKSRVVISWVNTLLLTAALAAGALTLGHRAVQTVATAPVAASTVSGASATRAATAPVSVTFAGDSDGSEPADR